MNNLLEFVELAEKSVDFLANEERGQKAVQNVAKIIYNLYNSLVESGVPEGLAAMMVSGFVNRTGK